MFPLADTINFNNVIVNAPVAGAHCTAEHCVGLLPKPTIMPKEVAINPMSERPHREHRKSGWYAYNEANAAEAAEQLTSGTLSAKLLETKLRKHVDQYDATEALEFMAQQGRGVKDLQPEEIYIGRQRAVADAVRLTLPGISLTVARDIIDPRSLPVIR